MKHIILVPLVEKCESGLLLDAALLTARQTDADIQAMFISSDPVRAFANIPEVIRAAGVSRASIERETRQAATAARSHFERWRAANDVPASGPGSDDCVSASWVERVGDLEAMITRFGRVSDFVVTQRPTTESVQSQHSFDAAVFGTGRPTLVVGDKLPRRLTDHIVIAWNGSLEASRAVAGAMPLLQRAKRLSIMTALEFDSDSVDLMDLADSLSHRHIQTPEVVFPTQGHSIGAELVAVANKQEATLIIMGAYTHSRLRQTFLGGVTRHLLSHSPVPLLMCH